MRKDIGCCLAYYSTALHAFRFGFSNPTKAMVTWLKSQAITFTVLPFASKMEFPLLRFSFAWSKFSSLATDFLNMKISSNSDWYFTRLLSLQGKEKQSRCESKGVRLIANFYSVCPQPQNTKYYDILENIGLYKCYLFIPADEVLVICTTGAFTTITDPLVCLSPHEVV